MEQEEKIVQTELETAENQQDGTRETGENQLREKEKTEKKQTKKKIQWFHINEKYMSISRYVLLVIVAVIIIYMVISHINETFTFIGRMFRVLAPFLIGLLLAYFLNPLVNLIQKKLDRGGKRPVLMKVIAIIISYVVVLGFIAAAFVFVVPEVAESIRELARKIPGMYGTIIAQIDVLARKFPDIDLNQLNDQLSGAFPNLAEFGTGAMGSVVNFVYSWSVSIVKTMINILLGIFISIYMIFSKEKFAYQAKRVIYAFFSEEQGDAICETSRECNDIFGAFLISKAIDSLIIGILCFILMSILRLPYAVLLSVIVGITNMIPYFGPFIGAVPGVLIFLCINWEQALIFAIMILVLQQFDGIILGPRLLGQSTGLSPIWVIFGVTVGGAYFGVIGMFIGVPVVAVIAHLCNKWLGRRLEGKKIKALERE